MSSTNRPFLGLALRLGAAFGLSTMYMLVKHMHRGGVSLPEIMFWRQAMTVPILLGWLLASGQMQTLRTKRLKSHALRSFMGTLGMFTLFGAQILLPLPVATVLGFTSPLFAVILTALVLRERVGMKRWGAVLMGFLGVLIIVQPGKLGGVQMSLVGALDGLFAAFMVAAISLQIRDLTRTESSISVVFYFAVFGSLFLLPTLPFVYTPHSPMIWGEIGLMAIVGTLGQLLLTGSLRYGSAATVLVMDYSTIVWTTIYASLVFDEYPPAHIWFGAPLIIGAGLLVAWREHRLQRVIRSQTGIGADIA